ncbi:MAG: TnsD family Tn7-like transposition protein [Cyclobacteriaceae bacterium]|nr:MAG: TnsD family Tn7-like transposition protein [Cyclobacteriaceae bacterium]
MIYNLATDLIQALTNQITPSISELKQTGQKKGFYKKINDSIYFDRTLYSDFLNYTFYNSRTMFSMVAENHQRLIKMMKGTWSGNKPILFFLVKRYLETLPDRPKSTIKNFELKCINKYCQNFNLKPIPSSFKYFDKKKNYGRIGKCETCGLEYEFSPSRTSRRILIRKIGPLMEKKIDELKEKHGYKKIANIIGISKYIVLKFLRHHISNKTEQGLLEKKREQYRNKWTFEITKLKSIKRTSQKHWGIYNWLLKNDRDWFDKINLKYRIASRSRYSKNKTIIEKLLLANDQMALKELQEIVASFNAKDEKRIFTKSFLASKTSFKKYEAIKKLPKSNEFVLMHTSSSP